MRMIQNILNELSTQRSMKKVQGQIRVYGRKTSHEFSDRTRLIKCTSSLFLSSTSVQLEKCAFVWATKNFWIPRNIKQCPVTRNKEVELSRNWDRLRLSMKSFSSIGQSASHPQSALIGLWQSFSIRSMSVTEDTVCLRSRSIKGLRFSDKRQSSFFPDPYRLFLHNHASPNCSDFIQQRLEQATYEHLESAKAPNLL